MLSLRHFGRDPFIPWRVGAEESGAAKDGFGGAMLLDRLGPPGRCSGCWPHDGEVAGGAVADLVLLISGPRVNLNSRPLRARGRGWPGRGLPVATGSLATERGRAKNRKTRRLLTNRPCSSLVYEESDSKERLRVSNWIVQRLYNYAVKKTVEL